MDDGMNGFLARGYQLVLLTDSIILLFYQYVRILLITVDPAVIAMDYHVGDEQQKYDKACHTSDQYIRVFPHGYYLCLPYLQLIIHLGIHLGNQCLQLTVQFSVAGGKAVGLFRQATALQALLCHRFTVERIDHLRGSDLFWLFLFAEKSAKSLSLWFGRFFLLSCLDNDRHLFRYLSVDGILLFQNL